MASTKWHRRNGIDEMDIDEMDIDEKTLRLRGNQTQNISILPILLDDQIQGLLQKQFLFC